MHEQIAGTNELKDGTPFDDINGDRLVKFITRKLSALGFPVPTLSTLVGSSGISKWINQTFTVNQSGTAGYTGLFLNVIETLTGSGAKLLQDLQVAGVSKFSVSNLGAVIAAGAITATLGDITATNGNLIAGTAGKGLRIKEGSNARSGSLTLVGGTITVANTSVTATTRIILSKITNGGTAGNITVTRSANTSFTVTSSSGTETSTFDYLLVEAI